MIAQKWLSVLVCPLCKSPLKEGPERKELICLADRLAYPIQDGIPVMLAEKARVVSLEEWEGYH